jgi:hypothetical protein
MGVHGVQRGLEASRVANLTADGRKWRRKVRQDEVVNVVIHGGDDAGWC